LRTALFHPLVRLQRRVQREAARVHPRPQLPGIGQRGGLLQDAAVGREVWIGYHRDLRRLARLRALVELTVLQLAN
jgi:hypothetical protein